MLVAIAVLVSAVVAVAAWRMYPSDQQPVGQRPAVVAASGQDAAATADVREVEALLARLPAACAAGDASVLSAAGRSAGLDLRSALPVDATVTMDVPTWRRTGVVGSAVVNVTAPAQPLGRSLVVFVREDGQWRVSSTYPVGSA